MTAAHYALPALASVCSKPANGGLLQGDANRLRRPALFLSAGAESLRIWPVCIMAAQTAGDAPRLFVSAGHRKLLSEG